MPSDETVLAFDTSAAHCAAALLSGDTILAKRNEAMARGQAERLVPLLEDVLAEGGLGWSDLTRIGVGIGPGNFTGIRISVSTARGLALGLGIPAIGISSFDALRNGQKGVAAVKGPRETAYVQTGIDTPVILPIADVPTEAAWLDDAGAQAVAIARLAATRRAGDRPAPLYIRAADAAPSSDPPPVILDDA